MADFATVEDLRARLLGRDLTTDEEAKAPALLTDATAIILARFPYLDPLAPPPVAVGVCCAMVLRVLRNPSGLRTEAIDDYSYTIDSSRSAGELYLTQEEARTLRSTLGVVFSITPGAPATEEEA
ncbi:MULTISPECIES: hypothetical protein [unclassified Streptomyces]|uniref:hypothetical protein n=1 Tax=unclassified Streptomyces TaxID=2593676 RepID=UPI00125E4E51|nr:MULTISPECIES: hypothetical protein [unclassified Streptomyces]